MVMGFHAVTAQQQVISDANAQQRTVSSFRAIEVSSAFDVFISQGNEEGLVVSAKTKEYRDRIQAVVENGVLKIRFEDNSWKGSGNRQLKAYISVKQLEKLTASGACDIQISGILKVRELLLNLSGATDLKGAVEAEFLSAELSGASDMMLTGRVDALKVQASGASDFKGFELQADKCAVRASGASDIKVTVNKELNAEASGASGIQYKGTGVIKDIKSSGASSVKRS